ncbi:MAG TPA: hypothetical protein VLJ39_05190, partial [Tepidisphaeraceae bacterium]|nr:hypothetical protein [Tepidisphaeraceae bacterium]
GQLKGTFRSGTDSFEFALTPSGSTATLVSGGATYHLRAQPSAADTAPDTIESTIHDDEPRMQCDAVQLRVPKDWEARGHCQWGLTALSPARFAITATSRTGPEMWAGYPVQTFVWRDNFNLFGLQFPIRPGDADPMTGEEVARPLPTAADCIRELIIPRFRKDLANAGVVSSREYDDADAKEMEKKLTGESITDKPGMKVSHKAAVVRFQYTLNNRPMEEELTCLTLYADIQSANLPVMHFWQTEFAASFRAERGKLEEVRPIADSIRSSIRIDPQWKQKAQQQQLKIRDAYAQRLRLLSQAQEANIRRQANDAIYQMTQQSYHRRMDMQTQQFHQMSNAVNGLDDYTTPEGRTIQAPISPSGQSAWLGSDGKTYNFNQGYNPNNDPRQHQSFTTLTPH